MAFVINHPQLPVTLVAHNVKGWSKEHHFVVFARHPKDDKGRYETDDVAFNAVVEDEKQVKLEAEMAGDTKFPGVMVKVIINGNVAGGSDFYLRLWPEQGPKEEPKDDEDSKKAWAKEFPPVHPHSNPEDI